MIIAIAWLVYACAPAGSSCRGRILRYPGYPGGQHADVARVERDDIGAVPRCQMPELVFEAEKGRWRRGREPERLG